MTDPAGSDRIQQDIPTASGTGDNSDTGSSFDDVPLTRDDAIERDTARDDELPATAVPPAGRSRRSGLCWSIAGAPIR